MSQKDGAADRGSIRDYLDSMTVYGSNVAAGGMIRGVEEVVEKSLSDRCRELVEPHIAYTVGMLKVHGVAQELIDATAHTYRQAWVHAWKHCLEEIEAARVEGK